MAIRNTLPEVWRKGGSHLHEINRLQRRMERMFENIFSDPLSNQLLPSRMLSPWISAEELGFTPLCDLDETDSHFLVSFDLPGVTKDGVKIELRDNQLLVSGERKEEHKVEKANRLNEERIYGSFMRTFTLPANIHADQVEAVFDNGVLKISIPKAEIAKPKMIPIKEVKEGKVIENKAA
jgi:HSP20 family protein